MESGIRQNALGKNIPLKVDLISRNSKWLFGITVPVDDSTEKKSWFKDKIEGFLDLAQTSTERSYSWKKCTKTQLKHQQQGIWVA